MNLLIIYTVVLMPVFLYFFIKQCRLDCDVTLSMLFAMICVSCLPFVREIVAIYLFGDIVVLKEYK